MKFALILTFLGIIKCYSEALESTRLNINSELFKGNSYDNDELGLKRFAEEGNINNKAKSESNGNSIFLKKNTINNESSSNINSSSNDPNENHGNDALHLKKRDTDSFYDNEIIINTKDINEDLPMKFQTLTETNGNPVSNYKEIGTKNIEKRESKKSDHYDYNYYDEQPEISNSPIRGLQGIKEMLPNISKILHPKMKKDDSISKTSDIKEKNKLSSNVSNIYQNDIAVKSLDNVKTNNFTDINQDKPLRNSQEELEFEEDGSDSTDDKKEEKEVSIEEAQSQNELSNNNNVISFPRGKDPCRLIKSDGANKEPINCLPTGGLPKVASVIFTSKTNDSDYNKTIKGDLIDKFVKTVMDKATRNTKMSTELGICTIDFKNVREQYNKARNKTDCCMKVVEELQCFLTWMLTADASRRKRSPNEGFIDYKKTVSRKIYDKTATCPECISVKEPSPEYLRLYEKIQQSKEDESSWEINSFNQPKDPE